MTQVKVAIEFSGWGALYTESGKCELNIVPQLQVSGDCGHDLS